MSNKTKLGIAIISVLFCVSAFWAGSVLKTQAENLPIISGIAAYVNTTNVTIQWKTDITTTGKVEYGTTSGNYTASQEVNVSATTFTVNLTKLEEEKTYYYRIKATETGGQTATSAEYSFVTSSNTLKFESIRVQSVTSDRAVIYFKTNLDAWGVLKYGLSASNLDKESGHIELLSGGHGNNVYHKTLTNLIPETTYYYQVTSTQYENQELISEIKSDVKSFKTTGLPEITSISPESGPLGTVVTINGKNFGAETADNELARKVNIGCTSDYYLNYASKCAADVISWDNAKIVVKVKKGAVSGNIYAQKFIDIYPGPYDIFTIKGPIFTVTTGTANINSAETANYVSEAYGCKFSTTNKDSSTIQVDTLFLKNSETDKYLKSVYDAYYAAWNRYPRCDELQFQLDHATPLERLKSWLAEYSITEKYGCQYSLTVSDENTVRLPTLFKLDSAMDKYLDEVYNAYYEAWGRYPRCDELEFHATHQTPLSRLTAWLEANKPAAEEEGTITAAKIEFKDSDSAVVLKDSSENLNFTTNDTITFSGITDANALVVLTVSSETEVYTTKSDSNGDWSYTLPGPLEAGDHTVKVAVFDDKGEKIRESETVSFSISLTNETANTNTAAMKKTNVNNNYLIWGGIILAAAIILIIIVVVLEKNKQSAKK